MRTTQGNMLRAETNVHAFIAAHADKLGAIISTGIVRELDVSIAELSGRAVEQADQQLAVSQSVGTTASLKRALFREHLAPMARIAKLKLPAIPELEPLRQPRMTLSVMRLATASRAMGKAAARYPDAFISAGMPQDFLARLELATDALVASLSSRDQSRGKAAAATEGLRTRLSHGRKIINVIDAFVQDALAGNNELLRHWAIVKRVEKVGGRSSTTSTGTVTPALTLFTPTPAAPEAPAVAAA